MKFVPVMTTLMPPVVGPDVGARSGNGRCGHVSEGAGRCAGSASVVTLTVTETVPAGETAVICVELLTAKLAAVLPKCTASTTLRKLPVMTTLVPPTVGPDVGVKPDTVGVTSHQKVPGIPQRRPL